MNSLGMNALSKPNTWTRRGNQRSRGRRAKQGMDALHKNIVQEESGICEIRYVGWTKRLQFLDSKEAQNRSFPGANPKPVAAASLVSENSLGIRFAEKSTSDEREKRNTARHREKGKRERRKRAVGSVEGTRLVLRGDV